MGPIIEDKFPIKIGLPPEKECKHLIRRCYSPNDPTKSHKNLQILRF